MKSPHLDNLFVPFIPKYEVRAVWITTVAGLDWPKTYDRVEQQRSLRDIVKQIKEANFNTIFFQVRGRADAVYRSHYEPWAQHITGIWGKDPGWDPLQFILEEAHAQGIEVHAWFNTFFVKTGQMSPSTWPPHLVMIHPDWVHQYEDQWWLDPGKPEVRAYLVRVAMDLVRSYTIDGIHFDFVRYPGPIFPDETTYRRYGVHVSKEQWRRENINAFVRVVYDSIIALKPYLKVGSTPMGVYMNIGNTNGQESYHSVFQDSHLWLRERKVDYLAPQVYWSLGNSLGDPDFATLAKDWAEHACNRHIYIGIGAYKQEVFEQIPDLIDVSRRVGADGNAFFRFEHIRQFWKVGNRYAYPAIIPPMSWKDSIPPEGPSNLVVQNVTDGTFGLQWRSSPPAPDKDLPKRYVIYRSALRTVDITHAENIVAITANADTNFLDVVSHPTSAKCFYVVTALDKGNNESVPTNVGVGVSAEIVHIVRQLSLTTKLADHYAKANATIFFIPYEIRERAGTHLSILDSSGTEVQTIVNGIQEPGKYIATFDAAKLKAGAYAIQLSAGDAILTKPLFLGKE